MRNFAFGALALLVLTALPLRALAGGGLVELVLPDQIPVSSTHPLPVAGSVSISALPSPLPVSQVGVTYVATDLTVTTTSSVIAASASLRTYLLIQNKGLVPIFLAFGGAAAAGAGVEIAAGGYYEPIQATKQSVQAITASSTALVTVVTGSL